MINYRRQLGAAITLWLLFPHSPSLVTYRVWRMYHVLKVTRVCGKLGPYPLGHRRVTFILAMMGLTMY